jgi:acetyl esterase/lipase
VKTSLAGLSFRWRDLVMVGIAAMVFCAGFLLSVSPRVRRRARILALPVWTVTKQSIAYGPEPAQALDIMQPRWPFRKLWPVVVVFHGGSWRGGSRASTVDRVCRRYLEHGYMAVNVGYRCSGIVPASADAIRALEWVFGNISNYGGDSGRVFVTGESAGAHLALLAAFSSRQSVRAVVNFYGVPDLTTFRGAEKDDSLPANDIHNSLLRLSPISLVRPGLCPVLSIHGSADPLVPVDQTYRLTRQLRQAGVEADEIIVEGGDHGFTEPQLKAIYERIFKFLESHLRP